MKNSTNNNAERAAQTKYPPWYPKDESKLIIAMVFDVVWTALTLFLAPVLYKYAWDLFFGFFARETGLVFLLVITLIMFVILFLYLIFSVAISICFAVMNIISFIMTLRIYLDKSRNTKTLGIYTILLGLNPVSGILLLASKKESLIDYNCRTAKRKKAEKIKKDNLKRKKQANYQRQVVTVQPQQCFQPNQIYVQPTYAQLVVLQPEQQAVQYVQVVPVSQPVVQPVQLMQSK